MSRSYDFVWGFPEQLGDELFDELAAPGHIRFDRHARATRPRYLSRRPRCACGGFHTGNSILSGDLVPGPAVVAALVERGWPRAQAAARVAYLREGYRYRHWRADDRRFAYRAFRRASRVLTTAARFDETAVERIGLPREKSPGWPW